MAQQDQLRKMLKRLFSSGATKPLSGKRMRKEVNASAGLAYNPQLRELENQRRISREMQKRTQSYFKDYQGAVRNAAQNTQNAYAQAQEQQANTASQIMGQNAGAIEGINAQRQDAASRFGAAPRFGPTDTLLAAQQNQGTQMTADNASLVRQGLTAGAAAQDKLRIGKGMKADALMQELARRRAIGDEKLGVLADKGKFKDAKRTELRGAERQYLIDMLSQHKGLKQLKDSLKNSRQGRKSDRSARNQSKKDEDEKDTTKAEEKADKNKDKRIIWDDTRALYKSDNKLQKYVKTGDVSKAAKIISQSLDLSPAQARRLAKRLRDKHFVGPIQP